MAQVRLVNCKDTGENFDGFMFIFSGTRFTTNKYSTADMQHKSGESRMLNTIPVVNPNNCSGINSNTNSIISLHNSTTIMNGSIPKQYKSSSFKPESSWWFKCQSLSLNHFVNLNRSGQYKHKYISKQYNTSNYNSLRHVQKEGTNVENSSHSTK